MTAGKNKLSQQKKKKINGGSQDGLGRALMRSRFNNTTAQVNPDGSLRHTTQVVEFTMKSVTEENDLDAFLTNAELAGTEFTAEKLHISVLSSDNGVATDKNPFLLSADQEAAAIALHTQWQLALKIPKRPYWDETTTAEQLQQSERESFLEWRRSLAMLEEQEGLLMTPYERNIQVWRQLWRVIERSELLVQIVDARNPILFRCVDMENYVTSVSPLKKNLLLVNKADMLSLSQRMAWASYFKSQGISFTFFSAALAAQALDEDTPTLPREVVDDPALKILDAHELLDLLEAECPSKPNSSIFQIILEMTIGFVGYPNVGKSSTLNALVGAKKVAVGSTPGKTKHFQTIHLSEEMILCDCPGLVFPSFSTTKADMVCNGVLPIDQLREYLGPAGLICQRVPKAHLERLYGIKIKTLNELGKPENRQPDAGEFLRAYAVARGYTRASQGNPDEARAARYILKDYVNGKILYVHPAPGHDPVEFNREIYGLDKALPKVHSLSLHDNDDDQVVKEIIDETESSPELTREVLEEPLALQDGELVTGVTRASWYTSSDSVKPASTTGLPPKKSHKKGRKNVKSRTNWTLDQ